MKCNSLTCTTPPKTIRIEENLFVSAHSGDDDTSESSSEIEGVTITVKQGDICDEQADAIVNGTNNKLDLSQGRPMYRNITVETH